MNDTILSTKKEYGSLLEAALALKDFLKTGVLEEFPERENEYWNDFDATYEVIEKHRE